MPQPMSLHQPIHILSDQTARRIAAGEVIDRPAAVLRELLDNSLDAGAGEIECRLEEGGNARIRIKDNGTGMAADDLELCGRPHATSKITTLEDLDRLTSLGFRGEALSSMAACARLEISSTTAEAGAGRRLQLEGGKRLCLEETGPVPGTTVDVSRLFFNMPARKKFLKRSQTEGTLCKTVFIEKALAHPDVSFRLWMNDKMVLYLPPATTQERIALAYGNSFPPDFLETVTAENEGFSMAAVCSGPDVSRPDRKFIQIFVNRRRIFEYSLLQAVEYAYDGYLPGGCKPITFVFMEIDPALVDFNIHPAKREARFRNLPQLHSSLAALIKGFLAKNYRPSVPIREHSFSAGDSPASSAGLFSDRLHTPSHPDILNTISRLQKSEITQSIPAHTRKEKQDQSAASGVQYLGQLWNVYLIGSRGEDLFLVDQHAAHERLLFDQLSGTPVVIESLAIPLAFDLEEDESRALQQQMNRLEKLGFRIRTTGNHAYELSALPQSLAEVPEKELLDFFKGMRAGVDELERRVFALIACRAAIKQGTVLDPVSAHQLLTKALALPDPHCPHGRPVIITFSRTELDKLFKRDV